MKISKTAKGFDQTSYELAVQTVLYRNRSADLSLKPELIRDLSDDITRMAAEFETLTTQLHEMAERKLNS